MKKFLIIAAVLTAFSLQAGDAAIPQLGKAKAQQEQLTAKKKRGVVSDVIGLGGKSVGTTKSLQLPGPPTEINVVI